MKMVEMMVTKKNSLELAPQVINCGSDTIFKFQNGKTMKGFYTTTCKAANGTIYRYYEREEGKMVADRYSLSEVAKALYFLSHQK